jgi:hypothetical protein
MSLTMRHTGLGSGIDKDRPDYGVYSGEWCIGRIYETRGGAGTPALVDVVTGPLARSDKCDAEGHEAD